MIVVLTIAALLLMACDSATDGPPDTDPSSPAVNTTGEGTQTIEVPRINVAFDAPSTWERIDSRTAASRFAENASRLGVTPADLQAKLESADLFLFDFDDSHDGFVDNINVLGTPGSLPTDRLSSLRRQYKRELEAEDNKLIELTRGRVSAGRYLEVVFTQDVGGRIVHCASFTVDVGAYSVVITTTATELEKAQSVMRLVSSSVRRT